MVLKLATKSREFAVTRPWLLHCHTATPLPPKSLTLNIDQILSSYSVDYLPLVVRDFQLELIIPASKIGLEDTTCV